MSMLIFSFISKRCVCVHRRFNTTCKNLPLNKVKEKTRNGDKCVLHAIWSHLTTSTLFFFALVHAIFLRAVPARGGVRGARVFSPVNRARAGMYMRELLTHVYCHHQEVALLNSSAELNSFLPARISSWEEEKHKQRFHHPRTVPLSDRSENIIFLRSHKNTGQTGHRCYFQQRHCFM